NLGRFWAVTVVLEVDYLAAHCRDKIAIFVYVPWNQATRAELVDTFLSIDINFLTRRTRPSLESVKRKIPPVRNEVARGVQLTPSFGLATDKGNWSVRVLDKFVLPAIRGVFIASAKLKHPYAFAVGKQDDRRENYSCNSHGELL